MKDEIFDMVKPKDPFRITLHDLFASQKATLVIGMLSDVNSFLNYEMRESQMGAEASE